MADMSGAVFSYANNVDITVDAYLVEESAGSSASTVWGTLGV